MGGSHIENGECPPPQKKGNQSSYEPLWPFSVYWYIYNFKNELVVQNPGI